MAQAADHGRGKGDQAAMAGRVDASQLEARGKEIVEASLEGGPS